MIKLQHVYKEYPIDGEKFFALNNVSLDIKKGEYSAILGPSGSGKSTLMHIMGLLDLPSKGNVLIDNIDVSTYTDNQLSLARNEFIGFVFQQFNLINKLTVLENVLLPTIYTKRPLSFHPRERAFKLLKDFGLESKIRSFPNKISGGQQQRVAIARALVMNPKLVLADEPTGNLDSKTGDAIMNLLEKLNKEEGVTVVIITHEKDIADRTKRKVQIRDGQIVQA
ncbi:MAG: ABC transporter, ATP-binding protein [Candidatus Gottesmanbacteria bacterium GW2011_GWA2_44_17]|uniref:ABC transporter, ATP-binding protein n=1 Tax=Candidatus Gottesmanbacteria bacterium GW2011_GWA2_44_17 TaxID=1618444 RepID=A0A0G1HJZ4_9BACT|nr:MAG: ABC transporter, ATP-binding protein [Microgenomates group bacterium GW2011_GWC1_43_11]KKT47260.1 MAG: ABC transporter, ATP-binding protein [Candidatus Gottesmanbacteria bacterium GW2011_GWA2_44_17]